MTAITLPEHLATPLYQEAIEQGSSIEAIVDEIITNYLRAQRHEKLVCEMEEFQEQHDQLVDKYAGRFIGMYNGRVLDDDEDGGELYNRLHKQFGNIPILIVEVKHNSKQEFVRLHRRVLT